MSLTRRGIASTSTRRRTCRHLTCTRQSSMRSSRVTIPRARSRSISSTRLTRTGSGTRSTRTPSRRFFNSSTAKHARYLTADPPIRLHGAPDSCPPRGGRGEVVHEMGAQVVAQRLEVVLPDRLVEVHRGQHHGSRPPRQNPTTRGRSSRQRRRSRFRRNRKHPGGPSACLSEALDRLFRSL